MDERSLKSWWRRRLPDLSAAASRFPLAVLIAGLFTFYRLNHDLARDVDARILGALAASFLWVVAVDFYVESSARSIRDAGDAVDRWHRRHRRCCSISIGTSGLARISYSGRSLILVGLAGHLGRGESNATFWLFNHRLWLGALLALVGAGLFAAGLVAIIETLNLLFGIVLPAHSQEHILTVSLCFVAPVSFLAFAPRSFTDPITAREEGDFTMRAAAALVKFVLVPLLLVYTAILYAYAVKIALAWELPKGTLGGMVVGYLLVGAATLLVGYPSRETGGPLVRFFWRYWVELAALPVVLLFIAVGRRLADYGVTEQRYLMVLIGIWALILAVIRVVRGGNFDLRLVPGVLALLLLAASFGPGGAIGFSIMSQKEQLAALLTEKGMLVDGKIVARGGGCARQSARHRRLARAEHRMVSQHPPLALSAGAVVRWATERSLRPRQEARGDRARSAARARTPRRRGELIRRRLFHPLFRCADGACACQGRPRHRSGRVPVWRSRPRSDPAPDGRRRGARHRAYRARGHSAHRPP